MLMQLAVNDQDDAEAYTRAINDWLLAPDGLAVPRRIIADPYGTSPLLSPAAQGARKVPGLAGGGPGHPGSAEGPLPRRMGTPKAMAFRKAMPTSMTGPNRTTVSIAV